MATKNSNYSILVDVELQTSNLQQQLNNAAKNAKININTGDSKNSIDDLTESTSQMGLTFQEANLIMSRSIEIISSMVEEVYNLDSALTEFKKVSNLSGESLDNYVSKLNGMGTAVARTGKPKCQAPDDGMVNQHQEPLEIQYNLRAYSTTMAA